MPDAKVNLEEMFRVLLLETLGFAVICAILTVVAPAPVRVPGQPAAAAQAGTAAGGPLAPDASGADSSGAGAAGGGAGASGGSGPGADGTAAAAGGAAIQPGLNYDAKGPGTLTGIIYDSQSGKAVENARVQLAGLGRTAVSDRLGRYGFTDVPAGRVTLRVRHDGYAPVEDTLEIGPDGRPSVVFALSAVLREGQLRLVLTWEPETVDLDAHLWTPADRPYHVYYPDSPNHRGLLDSFPFATLDRDSRKGNAAPGDGIETITIGKLYEGVYHYAVNQYGGDRPFSVAGPRLTVYNAGGVAAVYTPRSGESGQWWNVMQIDGATGKLTPVNTVGAASNGPYP